MSSAAYTGCGQFPIGFRRGWGGWQHRSASGLAMWAAEAGFGFLDLMNVTESEIQEVVNCGIQVGTIDLIQYGKLFCADEYLRRSVANANLEMIPKVAATGVKIFFACLVGDLSRSRIDNFRMAVDVMGPICEAAAKVHSTVVIEGYPGHAPEYLGIGCTPESVRAILREIPEGLSLNYDPSHLIRLGIEPIRFLKEFASRVRHVHAKNTELFPDRIYEYGLYQESLFQPHPPARRYAGQTWSYRLANRGVADWQQILRILADQGYAGGISIELEDEDYLGTEELEKEGLMVSRDFMASLR